MKAVQVGSLRGSYNNKWKVIRYLVLLLFQYPPPTKYMYIYL